MDSIRPYKGMQLDTFPTRKEEAFYNFALNTVLEGDNIAILQNERSNDVSFLLPEGYVQIGAIPMSNNEVAILSTNETSSEIGIFDGFNYTAYANLDLGFTRNHLIKGKFTIVNNCERSIYWQDGYNPDYFFNFDNIDFFKTSGSFDANKFRLQPFINLPQVSDIAVVDGGGSLLMGTYEFAIEILDDLLNPVKRSVISRMVSIYDEELNSGYNAIDGATNEENNPDGLPPTSKSIILSIDNIDTSYPYYRIYVIRRTGGDGINREVFKKSEVKPISGSTSTYIFTGITSTDTREVIDKLLVQNPYYEKCDVSLIVNRRNVRLNLKGLNIDYANFQRVSNNIVVKYVLKDVPVEDPVSRGNTKNPSSYFDTLSFQSDEVYALGIIFVFKQGIYSPVFHIPGRLSTTFDTELITVIPDGSSPTATEVNLSDAKHLGLGVGDTIERWKIFNTAYNNNPPAYLGYHQSESRYPETKDCNGEFIFGVNAGSPIRHHRMPDRRSIELIKDGDIRLIGLEFSNIVYPHPDIIGHFFVMGDRDEFNKTVVDTGYYSVRSKDISLTPLADPKFGVIYDRPGSSLGQFTDYGSFIGPKTQFDSFPSSGEYLKFNRNIDTYPTREGESFQTYATSNGEITLAGTLMDSYINSPVSTPMFRGILAKLKTSPNTLYLNVNGFDDIDGVYNGATHPATILRLEDNVDSPWQVLTGPGDIFEAAKYYYCHVKSTRDVFSNLFDIRYHTVTPIIIGEQDTESYGGDTFISTFSTFSVPVLFGGPVNDDDVAYTALSINNYFLCEGQINASMRYGTNSRCGAIYKTGSFNDFTISKIGILQDDGKYVIALESSDNISVCYENYYYNQDYSYSPVQQSFIPLPLNFDYCSDCPDVFENRIIWSEQSQVEGRRDSFRIFKEEDYTIVGENLGAITGAHYDNNQLVINCEDGFVVKIPNPQAIQTDEAELYIGTGDFLSLPERQLITTDYGFGGCRNVFSTVRTPRGYVWLDERSGKIFLKSDSLDELSSPKYGCSRWMKTNLPLNLTVQFRELFGEEYTGGDSRYHLAYDPIHERLIVHKTDWKFTNVGVSKVLAGDITFSNGKFYEGGTVVPFTNTEVFENKGFTISFSFILQAWVSFHSWQPFFMWTGYEAFYSSLENNTVWKHNAQPDGVSPANLSFYGSSYDWILDYTVFSTSTMTLNNLLYYSETMLDYVPAIVNFPTFDKMWVYTSQQSTGLKNIVPLDFDTNPYGNQIGFSYTDVDVTKRAEDYRISNIYDYSASPFFYSEIWQDKLSYYNGTQGYIDKVPLGSPTDITLYDLAPLRGKYFNIRLFSSSNLDMKFDFLASFSKPFEL